MHTHHCLSRVSLAALIAVLFTSLPLRAEPVSVMSFNIRYGTADDGVNSWPHRKQIVIDLVREHSPDLLGLQEALRDQVDAIVAAIPDYAVVGIGREKDFGGEYSAILYRRGRFDLSDSGTFWLSATPEVPGSRTWGNNVTRICTWARLYDRENDRRLLFVNTHWDHESQPARLESARLMAERLKSIAHEGEPIVITGDFNATESNPAMVELIKSCGTLQDSFRVLHPDDKGGTFNGFGRQPPVNRIDFVLANGHWQVKEAAIIRPAEGQPFPSDHFPVTATLQLNDN